MMDLSQESYQKPYAKVADGAWTVCQDHFHPAGLSAFPECNNRGFLYRVKNKAGKEHLLMSGIPGKSCIPGVQQLEQETGLELTLIVGCGDFHHMSTKFWLDAYPKVRLLQSDLKFPTTRNGKELLTNPTYAKQIELSHDTTFPQLQEYSNVVRFFGLDRFTSYHDQSYMSKSVDELTKESFFGFVSKVLREPATAPIFLVWHYHVPTKQLIYEHNFLFYFTKEEHAAFPFPLNVIMPKETFGSAAQEQFPHGPTKLEDCRAHCEQMKRIVDLDVRAIMDYHSGPGAQVRQWNSKEEYQSDMVQVLKKTGEHDVSGEAMYEIMRPKPERKLLVLGLVVGVLGVGLSRYMKRM